MDYDLVGKLIRLEDQSGNETSWTYDRLDRKTMETDELGNTWSFSYNEMDRLIRKIDAVGRTTLYGFAGYSETEFWYQLSTATPYANIATTTQVSNVAEYGFTVDKLGRVTIVLEEIGGLSTHITLSLDYNAPSIRDNLRSTLFNQKNPDLNVLTAIHDDLLNNQRLDSLLDRSIS